MPNANELVYDNYNFLVIAYCPSEKVSESYLSLGADKNGANLFFGYNGTKLADPRKLLQGDGTSNRFVRLESGEALERLSCKRSSRQRSRRAGQWATRRGNSSCGPFRRLSAAAVESRSEAKAVRPCPAPPEVPSRCGTDCSLENGACS